MIPCGIYPTMVTPFRNDNEVNYDAAKQLVHWYASHGCQGVFAVCQSSELFQLSLEERVNLVRCTVEAAAEAAGPQGKRMEVVASGNISLTLEQQVRELTAVYEAGADVAVIITNRMDFANFGEDKWISDMDALLKLLPEEIPLGLYECPYPYKRLLTDRMIRWCVSTGRFYFLKDTCCDPSLLVHRLKLLKGSDMKLFNANAQTLLHSLQHGASGYCGIMANFHPQAYVRLFDIYRTHPQQVERLAALLSMAAGIELYPYPLTAKYYLATFENIPMAVGARVQAGSQLTDYHKLIMKQLNILFENFWTETDTSIKLP